MTGIVKLTHIDKLLYPKDRISKEEVIQYYIKVSKLFLKYAKLHPLTLQRYPQGISKPGFFQKHADAIPSWIDRVKIPTKTTPTLYVLANRKADLAYLANLNTIVFHSALFSVKKMKYPDMLIWDLDPSVDDFDIVIEVAFKLKTFIESLGIQSLIKTTGSKGLHIQVPLNQRLTFNKVHAFAKAVAKVLEERYPKLITLEPYKKNRKGRVLIDYNRNFFSQTAVAAYSLRALPGAPVAAPILWKELGKTVVSARQFTLNNMEARVHKVGDIWLKEKIHNRAIHQLILNAYKTL